MLAPGTWKACDACCPTGEHSHYFGSYEPLIKAELGVVDAEDVVPAPGLDETDVWLTEWQVSEDGFDVVLGEEVDWELVPMDQEWLARLFAGRRTVSLQRDTSAGLVGELYEASSWSRCVGQVTRIDQVSVRFMASNDPAEHGTGFAEIGGAMQHTVASVQEPRGHHGSLIGWIVRIRSTRP